MDQPWRTFLVNVEGYDHIQSQESKICQILSCQGLPLEVSMDETKASQPKDS